MFPRCYGAADRLRRLPGRPLLGLLELGETEHRDVTGHQPAHRVNGVDHPLLVADHRDPLERGVPGEQRAQAEFEILDQATGPEPW